MDKDFDMEKVIEKMRELRDKRDLEILNKELDDINIDSDYKKELPKDKVLNVKYLGKIEFEEEINGEKVKTQKDIYLMLEQKEKDGELITIEKYLDEEGKVIAGNNNGDEYDFLMLTEEYKDHPKLLEALESLDREGILDLNELEQERIEEIAAILGIEPDQIEKLAEVSKDDIEKAEEELDAKERNDEDEIVLSEEEVEKISTKTEISVNQKVTDKDTLGSLLKVQDKGYKKIAVVYSDKLEERSGGTTKFAFVGINEDGSAEKIDSIEQEYGNVPTKKVNSLNRDGSEIEEKQMNSIYKIKGGKEQQIAVNIGSMGVIETHLVRTPNQDNSEAISIPIETQYIRPTTREVRELMNENRNPRVKEEIERIEEHREAGDQSNDINVKDIDDNLYNDSHKHFEVDNEYVDRVTREIMDDEEIEAVFTEKEVAERLKNNIEKNIKEKSLEEIKKETERELEEDASHFRKLEK